MMIERLPPGSQQLRPDVANSVKVGPGVLRPSPALAPSYESGWMPGALESFCSGEFVILGCEQPSYHAVLVLAAAKAQPAEIAFMIKHTSGVVCVALPPERLRALDIPLMAFGGGGDDLGQAVGGKAFTVSVDYRHGTTTGIAAEERAATLRALVDEGASSGDFARPGHVFPLRAREGGVLEHRGITEAAVDLARLAGVEPGTVLAELVSYDGELAGRPEVISFSLAHGGIPVLSVDDVVASRWRSDGLLEQVSARELCTESGRFVLRTYRERATGREHVAVTCGDLGRLAPVPVRLHSACLSSQIFGSAGCRCGSTLRDSVSVMAGEGRGVLIYRHGGGGDTPVGWRPAQFEGQQCGSPGGEGSETELDSIVAARILEDLGVRAVRLLGDSPLFAQVLKELGFPLVESTGPAVVAGHVQGWRLLPSRGSDNRGLPGADSQRRVQGVGRPAEGLIAEELFRFLWAG
jgi:3,4-dihydroxy 2-butanone 4-phosphate synthase / GTP cyclohydrolase II